MSLEDAVTLLALPREVCDWDPSDLSKGPIIVGIGRYPHSPLPNSSITTSIGLDSAISGLAEGNAELSLRRKRSWRRRARKRRSWTVLKKRFKRARTCRRIARKTRRSRRSLWS